MPAQLKRTYGHLRSRFSWAGDADAGTHHFKASVIAQCMRPGVSVAAVIAGQRDDAVRVAHMGYDNIAGRFAG